MAGLVILDAGVLIALFQDKDAHHQWASDLVVITIESELAISALTMAEAMVYPARAGLLPQYRDSLDGLGVKVFDFKSSSAVMVAELRAVTGLKTPDALVLQQAMELGADIATTDKTLAKKAREFSIGVFQPN